MRRPLLLAPHPALLALPTPRSPRIPQSSLAPYLPRVNWASLLTLPNFLSSLRFPLAAVFVLADGMPARVTLLGLASATDLLDGWLARRTGRTTRWGALLDPVADKTFVFAALTAFVVHRELSLRDHATILSRDIGTAAGALVGKGRHGELPL